MSTHTAGPEAKFAHANLLNELVEMQGSPAYAVRKQVLIEAELAIAAADIAADETRAMMEQISAGNMAHAKAQAIEIDNLRAQRADLLAALIECEDLLAELATGGAENPELEMVRAAISRATGGKLAAT